MLTYQQALQDLQNYSDEIFRLRAELAAERADKTRIAEGWNEASDERDALRELLRDARRYVNLAVLSDASGAYATLARIDAALKGGRDEG